MALLELSIGRNCFFEVFALKHRELLIETCFMQGQNLQCGSLLFRVVLVCNCSILDLLLLIDLGWCCLHVSLLVVYLLFLLMIAKSFRDPNSFFTFFSRYVLLGLYWFPSSRVPRTCCTNILHMGGCFLSSVCVSKPSLPQSDLIDFFVYLFLVLSL